MPTSPPQPLLTIKQVALALNVSTKTVRRLIEANRLQHHRIGGDKKPLVRVAHEDLRAYIMSTRA